MEAPAPFKIKLAADAEGEFDYEKLTGKMT